MSLPALCADTVALKNLVRELSRCYAACLQGDERSDTSLQYADIAQWQNQLLEADDPEAETEYWAAGRCLYLREFEAISVKSRLRKLGNVAPQLLSRQIALDLAADIEAIAQQFQTNCSSISPVLLANSALATYRKI